MADQFGLPVPPLEERVYSITFSHSGEDWIATVGEQLRGIGYRSSRSRQKSTERTIALRDSAVVLAIFPGTPFTVFTNKEKGSVGSAWHNPFRVEKPASVTRFSMLT